MAQTKVQAAQKLQLSETNSHYLHFDSGIISNQPLFNGKKKITSDVWGGLNQSSPRSSNKTKHDVLNNALQELFAENVLAKLWRVATRDLENNDPPIAYPEDVPQIGEAAGRYFLREADFWTCGFFPGTLFGLLERIKLYPQILNLPENMMERLRISSNSSENDPMLQPNLLELCRKWSEPLHQMANRTDTHDLGFIIEPALRADWELTGNKRSLRSVITAAHSLASRFDPRVQAIRSWDLINKKDVKIISMEENFIIIIDSLCNLDLLFYASAQSGDESLAEKARLHAHTLLYTHLRKESAQTSSRAGYNGQMYSTCHVANLDPRTGQLKARMTAQGYAAESTWARGQSWGILGYSQTYMWTKERVFLDAACGLAEYFLLRLQDQEYRLDGELRYGCKVPLWDFDAPIEDPEIPVLDSSAGVIAAYGMLLLSQALSDLNENVLSKRYLEAALAIVSATLEFSSAEEKAKFVYDGSQSEGFRRLAVEDVKIGRTFDSVLKNATANNNVGARKRYANHGLVYADYYLVKFGNELLKMELI